MISTDGGLSQHAVQGAQKLWWRPFVCVCVRVSDVINHLLYKGIWVKNF